MKWTLTISGLDLGTAIPDPTDPYLQWFPLETLATDRVCAVLARMSSDLHRNRMDALTDPQLDTPTQVALHRIYDQEDTIIQHILSNLRVTVEPE